MASIIGDRLKLSIFGQSHGQAIGMVLDGLPPGETIDGEQLAAFLERRAPGKSPFATSRREPDLPQILSGLFEGRTCGAPLCATIENQDMRSGDYEALKSIPRPSHADYGAHIRYGGYEDPRGGGHFSGRLTAPLCIAGGICMQILERRGIFIGAHIHSIERVVDEPFRQVGLTAAELMEAGRREFPVNDPGSGSQMKERIAAAREAGDSVGGIVECGVIGLPAGLGDPMFGGVENRLSAILFGIPAVRGVEFGAGFAAARMRGSEHNDPFVLSQGKVTTETNHHGGVLGGITTGMPLLFRACFKPTPSIAMSQRTVNLAEMGETALEIRGRHDPCIVQRAVPCVEAAAAVAILDLILGADDNLDRKI